MKYLVDDFSEIKVFDTEEKAKAYCWECELSTDIIIEIEDKYGFIEWDEAPVPTTRKEKRRAKLKSLWYELCDFIEYDLFDYAVIVAGSIIVVTEIVLAVLILTTTI